MLYILYLYYTRFAFDTLWSSLFVELHENGKLAIFALSVIVHTNSYCCVCTLLYQLSLVGCGLALPVAPSVKCKKKKKNSTCLFAYLFHNGHKLEHQNCV